MDLSVIGSGHVGLVSGACFAEKGHRVVCADDDAAKIEGLKRGRMPFFEPGLEDLVRRNAREGRLSFTASAAEAVAHGRAVFVSVWTPPGPTGRADLSAVEKVSRAIAASLPPGGFRLIVEKSTVPVRTGERVLATLRRFAPPGSDYEVASNPEFLREGTAIRDTLEPDRIVIGAGSARARALLEEIYAGFPGARVVCDVKSAEMIKHASNSFLALKISFINAVARVCEASGADVETVAHGMGLDPRISPHFLKAGLGYGGSCFPKDVAAFVDIARELGVEFQLLEEVQRINREMRLHFVERVERELWNLKDKPVAVLGLAFKPGTDDLRFAPALTVIEELLRRGARVRAWDPVSADAAREALAPLLEKHGGEAPRPGANPTILLHRGESGADPGGSEPSNRHRAPAAGGPALVLAGGLEDAVRGAEAVCVCTEWPEIVNADWAALRSLAASPVLFDGRNCLDPARLGGLGWTVFGVGRGKA
ncbi:MAG: UDP-glucose/GDP-mannose dehydrogenase family protein [Planctomycetes bacterium]|nr:UDP-glucose/GDP-mannose dehydrogenase family protein [Planctomycetota bacterium]